MPRCHDTSTKGRNISWQIVAQEEKALHLGSFIYNSDIKAQVTQVAHQHACQCGAHHSSTLHKQRSFSVCALSSHTTAHN